MKPPHLVTLTTDFGASSHYVAQLKGVLLGINPALQVIDLTHTVGPQRVAEGAFLLQQTVSAFPPETCHIAVIDPGVGTDRRIVLARMLQQYFIAPDNGLLSPLAQSSPPEWIVELNEPRYWRATPRRTFHGRDIMAPVAGHLSLGVNPQKLGRPLHALVKGDGPAVLCGPRQIRGTVVTIDHFGNLITDIGEVHLAQIPASATLRVQCGAHEVVGRIDTYAERPAGDLVALVGSGGYLELAQVNGHAARALQAQAGQPIVVAW